jgi:alkanesulfonate monooxygenase SsuD/methylene tetrahydromethanopterin reductase-like flavin-dependent oxidoreductase (luciferase family)
VALEVWSSDYQQLESTCRRAERLGFDALYYGESPHDLNLECWTTLAALARATSRIRLGPIIANVLPTYRSTILLARQAAAVASISGGRLDFRSGVGASAAFGRDWWEPFDVEYPPYEQRLADLEAALGALPRLWSDHGPIPITIAARGERAMAVAARDAQVWETSFCTPDEFRQQAARMTELLGDDDRQVVRSLEIDGFVSTTPGGFDRLLDRVGTERGSAEDLDPILDRALVGTPPEAASRLTALGGAGVEQVVVALHDPHDPDALEALAETRAVAAAGLPQYKWLR